MISKVSSTDDKKTTIKAVGAGAVVGMAAPSFIFNDTVQKLSNVEAKSMAKVMKATMPSVDSFEHTKDVAFKILEETGLKSKGVKINFIDDTAQSLNHLKETVYKETGHRTALGKRLCANDFETFKEGANAAFFSKANEVFVHSKNLHETVYHELGHAMNKNGNFFTRTLQKARIITPMGISVLAPVFLAVGLLHKVDENKPKEEKGKMERALDFVSNNAGKLTLASYLPLLAEEGLASVRGLKAASKHLSRNVIDSIGKNYMKAWGSYAATAAMVSGGVALGVAIAKRIRNKNEAKAV